MGSESGRFPSTSGRGSALVSPVTPFFASPDLAVKGREVCCQPQVIVSSLYTPCVAPGTPARPVWNREWVFIHAECEPCVPLACHHPTDAQLPFFTLQCDL